VSSGDLSWSGNGGQNIGTINVPQDSVNKWPNDGGFFSVLDDENAVEVNSQVAAASLRFVGRDVSPPPGERDRQLDDQYRSAIVTGRLVARAALKQRLGGHSSQVCAGLFRFHRSIPSAVIAPDGLLGEPAWV
jgi:hypothetical protein